MLLGLLRIPQTEVIRSVKKNAVSSSCVISAEMFLNGLKVMRPNAAILTAVIPMPPKEADANTPTIRCLPPTIMSLHHPRYAQLNEEELKLECKQVFEQELVVT